MIYQGTTSWKHEDIYREDEVDDMKTEEELERLLITKADSVTMKKFLQQKGDTLKNCNVSQLDKKHCEECHVMNDMNNVDDIELYKKLWDGVESVTVNGKKRVTCKYMYRDDINVTFALANIKDSVGRTKRLVSQLKKKRIPSTERLPSTNL